MAVTTSPTTSSADRPAPGQRDPKRTNDIALLGATGFTGALVADHLASRVFNGHAGDDASGPRDAALRWAIAGRNPDKLERLADDLALRHGDAARPDVVIADIDDPDSLDALAGRTRVLATTVGPYVQHGEPVVAACVRAGTHYADITGEPAFVDAIRARHDAAARDNGVAIVTCCGFDSVPHDLGAWFTVGHLPDDVPISVRGYVRGSGRISGGTAASAVQAIAAGTRPQRGTPAAGSRAARRAVHALPARIHRVAALQAYGVPLPTIDPVMIARSAAVLPGYGTAFRYGHYARVGRLPTVIAGVGVIGGIAAMAKTAPTRRVLHRLLPAQGDGPSAAQRAKGSFEVVFIGSGGDRTVMTRVAGGDPGYGETSRMLGEAALSLAFDGAPRHPGATADDDVPTAGILTPAIALGAPYQRRLAALGITFEVLNG
jgi:short subunit dehydrogenase-like uncharacterized protein